jgi:hypothetical protein
MTAIATISALWSHRLSRNLVAVIGRAYLLNGGSAGG